MLLAIKNEKFDFFLYYTNCKQSSWNFTNTLKNSIHKNLEIIISEPVKNNDQAFQIFRVKDAIFKTITEKIKEIDGKQYLLMTPIMYNNGFIWKRSIKDILHFRLKV